MSYCPKCRNEVADAEEVCPDCYVDLIREVPADVPDDFDDSDWVDIYSFTSSMYARMAVEMLQREGVPSYSQSMVDGSLNLGTSTTVFVLEQDLERAQEVIEPIIDELPDIPYEDDDYSDE